MSDVVLDASAVLALIHRERGADIVASVLSSAAISTVNVSEVIAKLSEDGMPESEIINAFRRLHLDIVPLSPEQAYDAGLLRSSTRSLGLSLGDRCCLSLARSLGLPVMTADNIWARLSVGVDVRVIR